MDEQFTIRNMKPEELSVAIKWAKNEGWNPGIHDKDTLFKGDPNGFFLGEISGEVVAVGSGVAYDGTYGFCGLYIVSPEHRGKGYGMALTKARLAYLGDRNVGIDGVLENVPIYKNIGYVPYYHHRRYELTASSSQQMDPSIKLIKELSSDQILEYDRRCFPASRKDFLLSWLSQEDGHAIAYVKNGQLMGYAVRRRCYDGHKVGPLFADQTEIAAELLKALQNGIDGEKLYIDCPDNHTGPEELQKQFPMTEVFVTARMYQKGLPDIDESKVFGITTMELG